MTTPRGGVLAQPSDQEIKLRDITSVIDDYAEQAWQKGVADGFHDAAIMCEQEAARVRSTASLGSPGYSAIASALDDMAEKLRAPR